MTKQAQQIREHIKRPGLKPFWLSFWMKSELYPEFECEFPWWTSGQRGDDGNEECSIVAYILAKNQDDAWAFIDSCFDSDFDYEQRFCDQGKTEYTDRFVKPDWSIDPNDYAL